jgi:hypothetical protein
MPFMYRIFSIDNAHPNIFITPLSFVIIFDLPLIHFKCTHAHVPFLTNLVFFIDNERVICRKIQYFGN